MAAHTPVAIELLRGGREGGGRVDAEIREEAERRREGPFRRRRGVAEENHRRVRAQYRRAAGRTRVTEHSGGLSCRWVDRRVYHLLPPPRTDRISNGMSDIC